MQIAIKSALVRNQIDVGVLACVLGAGFGQFFDYHVLAEIKAGKLVHILEKKAEDEPIPAGIVYPSARHVLPNVRSFAKFAQPRIREQLRRLQKM